MAVRNPARPRAGVPTGKFVVDTRSKSQYPSALPRPSRPSVNLARRLLGMERRRTNSRTDADERRVAGDAATATARVCEKLRVTLSTFAGTAGFRSLLTRALTLARAEQPSLARVQVLEDGSIAGLETLGDGSDRTATAAGLALVAQVLDLLIILIGEPLTLHLVGSAWPAVSASALRSRDKETE
jgi:hypothetical protein